MRANAVARDQVQGVVISKTGPFRQPNETLGLAFANAALPSSLAEPVSVSIVVGRTESVAMALATNRFE